MAFRDCFTFFLVFFLISICFLSTSTLARPHTHRPNIMVDLLNDLPNNTHEPLELSCDQGSSAYLKQGDHYNLTLKVDRDSECTATWWRWFTTWDAYEAKRDKGHDNVYWLVKKDGFYHSWDGSKWKLVEYWYTE